MREPEVAVAPGIHGDSNRKEISGTFSYVGLGHPAVAGVAFTDRHCGFSTGVYQGLNLGLHVGDDPQVVADNRRLVDEFTGQQLPVSWMDQVHGTTIGLLGHSIPAFLADTVTVVAGQPGDTFPRTDALIACGQGIPVGVLVADCVPLLMADPEHRIVAAVHAGRQGAAAAIAEKTLQVMVACGATPATITAFIGPSARGCCYEVAADMARSVNQLLPGSGTTTTIGTPGLDLAVGLRRQLTALGVGRITVDPHCTICDTNYFSYRRARTTGRQAGIVWMS